jgi:hypothetical protein
MVRGRNDVFYGALSGSPGRTGFADLEDLPSRSRAWQLRAGVAFPLLNQHFHFILPYFVLSGTHSLLSGSSHPPFVLTPVHKTHSYCVQSVLHSDYHLEPTQPVQDPKRGCVTSTIADSPYHPSPLSVHFITNAPLLTHPPLPLNLGPILTSDQGVIRWRGLIREARRYDASGQEIQPFPHREYDLRPSR